MSLASGALLARLREADAIEAGGRLRLRTLWVELTRELFTTGDGARMEGVASTAVLFDQVRVQRASGLKVSWFLPSLIATLE